MNENKNIKITNDNEEKFEEKRAAARTGENAKKKATDLIVVY